MRHIHPAVVGILLLAAALGLLLVTGCDLLDQFIGGGSPPGGGSGSGAPQAVIRAEIDDAMVDSEQNPDLRPPLRYQFNALDSLDKFGDPIRKGTQEVAWDFGDGDIRGFEWSDYVTQHLYKEPGTYTVTLTVREPETYGGTTGTAQETITIGPAWLKIVSMTTTARTDGQFDVTVVVQNQSDQVLGRISIALLDDNGWTARGADVTLDTPNLLAPGETYTLKALIATWTGTLRAISWWCYPAT